MVDKKVQDLRAVASGAGGALLVYYSYAVLLAADGAMALARPATWLGLLLGVGLTFLATDVRRK